MIREPPGSGRQASGRSVRMHSARCKGAVFASLILFCSPGIAGSGLMAQTKAKAGSTTVSTSLPSPRAKVPTLAQARTELSLLEPGKALTTRIYELLSLMSPSDSLAILGEFAGRATIASRQDLWTKAASLALLTGRFQDAGAFFESAAGEGTGEKEVSLLLRAARCRIASGNTFRARELATDSIRRVELAIKSARTAPKTATSGSGSAATTTTTTTVRKPAAGLPKTQTSTTLPAAPQGDRKPVPSPRPDSLDGSERLRLARIRADIVAAWSRMAEGQNAPCIEILRPLVSNLATGAPRASAERREALFILWYASEQKERKEIAATLGSEYPDSPEMGILRGDVKSPPLPHWLLGILPASRSAPDAAVPAEGPRAAGSAGASSFLPPRTDAGTEKAQDRLQVGYFSREENAKIFSRELIAKGFIAYVELRPQWEGSPRWAVTVEIQTFADSVPGGAPTPVSRLQATQMRLKEFGYESYPVE